MNEVWQAFGNGVISALAVVVVVLDTNYWYAAALIIPFTIYQTWQDSR